MVELRQAVDLAHRLEDYLRVLRGGERGADCRRCRCVVRRHPDSGAGRRRPPDRVEHFRPPTTWSRGLHGWYTQTLPRYPRQVRGEDVNTPSGALPLWRCNFAPSAELMARGMRVDTVRERLAAAGDIIEAVPRVAGDGSIAFDFLLAAPLDKMSIGAWRADGIEVQAVQPEPVAVPEAEQSLEDLDVAAPAGAPSQFVRVELSRLDALMRNVGDLVIGRARLADTLSRVESHVPAGDWRAIQENAVQIDRHLRTLREGIMRVRLVPVGEIFRRMPFVVRDLARDTGKRVRMELRGQGTEIDKFLIERMMDPVLHLVRNAVSHGIETVEERLAAGKGPEGTIVLSAATVGDIVRIDIADDGRGVDADEVLARARAAGLAVPPGELDPAALLALICSPGLSTRDRSDRASGRGVGMSVVHAAVQELTGTLRLETEKGTGTRFVLELPVTLAITDALIATVGSETFAVPQGSVREVIEVAAGTLLQVEQNEMVPYRGAALPVVRLSRLFRLADSTRDRMHLFVVGSGATAIGIAVDRIVGQREIVVRAIVDTLVKVDGISGATDLGDGHVVLILDPLVLSRKMRERPDRVMAGGPRA